MNNITKTEPTYLFHYTSEARLSDIIKSGKLKVSNAALTKKERPALWLSTEEDWDESALKFDSPIDKKGQWQIMGLGRIVVNFFPHFVTYGKWRHDSRVNPLIAENERKLYPQYDRTKWWASFKDIPINDFLYIEYWNGQRWCIYDKKTPSVFNVRFVNNQITYNI